MTEVSIIVRSKNEERWITACLDSIFSQTFKNLEVILVDNASTDRTVEKAKVFNVQVVEYQSDIFYPGFAINEGIRVAKGKYIVIISAHCIPVDENWLENLVKNFSSDTVAGVYGRQEPLPYTNDLDKRDLINIFGLDRKIQKKDPFFHNANSIIRRDVWDLIPFDEKTRHIEDRIWAQKVLQKGYSIVYEPKASVFHYHGINQGRNIDRATRIVKILESIHDSYKNSIVINSLNICAIIPSIGEPLYVNGAPLIERTISAAFASHYIDKVFVASDNDKTLSIAEGLGSDTIKRPKDLSGNFIGLVKVYQYAIKKLQDEGYFPDLLVLLEEVYPIRPDWLLDRMVEGLLHGGHDSVVAAVPEYGSVWRNEGGELKRVDQGFVPSSIKEPLYRGMSGLGCVTHTNVINQGSKVGKKVGLIKVENHLSSIPVRGQRELLLLELWEKANIEKVKVKTGKI